MPSEMLATGAARDRRLSEHAGIRGETVDMDLAYARSRDELLKLHGRATPLRRPDGSIRGAVLVLYPRTG